MSNNKRTIVVCISVVILILSAFSWLFYPKQQISANDIHALTVITPDKEKYRNDCLHPCIRYSEKGFAGYHYWMAQSPYYGWNNKVENPILYRSNTLDSIGYNGLLIADTPETGYNSDPNLFIDGDSVLYVFWRECDTPLCDSVGHNPITVGVSTKDGVSFTDKTIYLVNQFANGDTEQAPILMKHGEEYWFYATWYQYAPERKNKGIAIWKSVSLSNPDFLLTDTIPVKSIAICDKKAEVRLKGYHLYCPWPQHFDLWHYDLWVKEDGSLGIIASAEKGDMIMVGESEDWHYFEFNRTPLVMNHFMQNHVGYRQYYYKPTACVDGSGTHYFWTSASKEDGNRNVLWHGVAE